MGLLSLVWIQKLFRNCRAVSTGICPLQNPHSGNSQHQILCNDVLLLTNLLQLPAPSNCLGQTLRSKSVKKQKCKGPSPETVLQVPGIMFTGYSNQCTVVNTENCVLQCVNSANQRSLSGIFSTTSLTYHHHPLSVQWGKSKFQMISMGQKLIQVLNKHSLSSFGAVVAFIAYLLVLWSLYIL